MSPDSQEMDNRPKLQFGTEVLARQSREGVVIHTRSIRYGLVFVAMRHNGGLSPQLSSEPMDQIEITGLLSKAETRNLLKVGVENEGYHDSLANDVLEILAEYEDDPPHIL